MIWGEETPGRTDEFEARALPRAKRLDPDHALQISVGAQSPEADPTRESGGSAEAEASAGRSAWRRRLSPTHRRAVRTFFAPAKDG